MQLLVGRVRYNRRDEKWQAYLDYRDPEGKRHYKSRYYKSEQDAKRGAKELEGEYAHYFQQTAEAFRRVNGRPPYTCPSCKIERPYKNRRVIRFQGESVAICRGCYNQGPVVVGQNLRANMEGLS